MLCLWFSKKELTVDLTNAEGEFSVKWIHQVDGTINTDLPIKSGVVQKLNHLFASDTVLYLIKN